ncbi:hypothetical protein PtA15_16A52 [Puccinia triticina]|uniref:Uncharacterized protein n=1 Tax=Puccinia triticina TaxID=208348 RepID=A0ABY7D411_9BASI|nr:uncharacterized protein PtA15_16A52 [Puccinia triticina]WAQ92146.1 hypothetical protein PtA15_16A52 [Puccinia triticina]
MDETIRMALEAQNQALLAQIQAFIQASEARTGLLIAELEGRVNQHITNSISAAETRINTHMATKIRESVCAGGVAQEEHSDSEELEADECDESQPHHKQL